MKLWCFKQDLLCFFTF